MTRWMRQHLGEKSIRKKREREWKSREGILKEGKQRLIAGDGVNDPRGVELIQGRATLPWPAPLSKKLLRKEGKTESRNLKEN